MDMRQRPFVNMKRIVFVNTDADGLCRSIMACYGKCGFDDANALESYSNDITPCIKTMIGFILLVEVEDENSNIVRNEG